MVFKEFLQKLKERKEDNKELVRQLDERSRAERLVEERQKSANQRELERYMKEDYEKEIKARLEYARKKRSDDISYNHNPLFIKNITNHTDWEVLKEKNQFTNNRNLFVNQPMIHRNNPNLFKNNKRLIRQR